MEFEIEGESASGVLLTSCDFISYISFEKRTIRGEEQQRPKKGRGMGLKRPGR